MYEKPPSYEQVIEHENEPTSHVLASILSFFLGPLGLIVSMFLPFKSFAGALMGFSLHIVMYIASFNQLYVNVSGDDDNPNIITPDQISGIAFIACFFVLLGNAFQQPVKRIISIV